MPKKLVRFIVLSLLVCAAGAVHAQIRTADVTGGHVEGIVSDGIASFKGIPFAAPPVGANRWRAPQPVESWSGTRRADAYAPSCMQDASMGAATGDPVGVDELRIIFLCQL